MIDNFSGPYAFLSNFYTDSKGHCVEVYYQAAKTLNAEEVASILFSDSPGEAKKKGKSCTLRPDWELIKLGVMESLVRKKFEKPELRKALLETGDEELVEGYYWNDTYWGVYKCVGENHLGKILMKIRKELQQ